MTANDIANRLTNFLNWIIGNPLGFLLWITAALTIVGLGFGTINQIAKGAIVLPTYGVTPQTAIYVAGCVYLFHGKV